MDGEPIKYVKIVEHDRAIALSDDLVLTISPVDRGSSRVELTIGGDVGRKLRVSRIGKASRRERLGYPKVRKKD
jgi:hypothetical protein